MYKIVLLAPPAVTAFAQNAGLSPKDGPPPFTSLTHAPEGVNCKRYLVPNIDPSREEPS
jgi:hypothetical protein